MIHTFEKGGIGDLHSSNKGTGARFNAGKPDFALLPLTLVSQSLQIAVFHPSAQQRAIDALYCLGQFQATKKSDTLFEALRYLGLGGWDECAHVFDYGKKKYVAWNWAKGMPWSAPIASAARHLIAMAYGQETDTESGLPHRGHVFCNIVMLLTYLVTYPEGDDLPPHGMII